MIDILLVAFLIYRVLLLVRGTRFWRTAIGVMASYLILLIFSRELNLDTLNWLLEKSLFLAPVALVILFLPELRQALEGVGRLGEWTEKLVISDKTSIEARTIEEVVAACAEMSASRVGALIVLEKGSPLSDIAGNGVQIDAKLSAALLCSIFYEGNPLHDGAAIIRGTTIVAAACRLPLSESSRLDATVHMRHRAAVGLAEQRDAIVVVVSEERGTISIASEGKLLRLTGPSDLRDVLKQQVHETPVAKNGQMKRIFSRTKVK
ncbi:MAG TPA: diadenylate cyclase CdaA [Fimbriimonadaceae bacterium]